MVTELEIYYATDHNNSKLRAATFGRGLWETLLYNSNGLATVETGSVSLVSYNSATVGGDVTNEGASSVSERGVVYSTTANPTISDNKVADSGSGTGAFTASLTGLSGSTIYYVRAYATNTAGTFYGNDVQFTTHATGINELQRNGINIYPNPSDGVFKVVINEPGNGAQIHIKDISGKKVLSDKITDKITEIDLSNFSRGVYFIELIVKDKIYLSKIIQK